MKDHDLHDPTPHFSWDWYEHEGSPWVCDMTGYMHGLPRAQQADLVMTWVSLSCADTSE